MTKCKSCGVSVDKALSHCPLCHRKFDTQTNNIISEWYPTYEVGNGELNSKKYRSLINKTVWFISILACCALSFINAFVTKEPIWCHIVIIPIVYVAFTITHTICSQAHLGLKILFQVVAISGLLVVIGVISTFIEKSSAFNPFVSNCFCKSNCNFSLTKAQDARRKRSLICVLESVPLKPRYSRLTAISISSEKRSIKFQHLLNEVPPFKR